MYLRFTHCLILSNRRHWLLLEAIRWLGLARAAVLTLPFRRIMAALGQRPTMIELSPPPTNLSEPQQGEIQQVTWAIRVVSRRTPWQSNRLAQALAGQILVQLKKCANNTFNNLPGLSAKYVSVMLGRIWELLAQPHSVADLSATLVQEFDVDAETCQREVATFVQQLVEEGLLQVG